MTSVDDSRKRSKGANNTLFELRQRMDVTLNISRTKPMVTMHRDRGEFQFTRNSRGSLDPKQGGQNAPLFLQIELPIHKI